MIIGYILIGLFVILVTYLVIFFKFGYIEIDSNVCLVGRTALVTGGSSGIGYQIVLSLASRGCRVIVADILVDETIKASIMKETDNPNIVLEYVDFASFKSIRNFVEKFKTTEEKLDILVNNVGIGKAPEVPSEDGLNITMQINHYGPFLLTHLLIDALKKSRSGRIIFTSSVAAFMHNMNPSFVTEESIKNPRYRAHDYANAKFCNVVTSDIFAEKLKKYNITSNTYHPGIAQSTFFKNTLKNLDWSSFTDLWAFVQIKILSITVGVPPKKAAQAGVNLAISKKFENITGIFFGKYFPNLKPSLAYNKDFCYKLWKASEKIVQLRPEEVI